MVAKSCLKQNARCSTPRVQSVADYSATKQPHTERRKSVTFSKDDEEEVKEEVFYADEWDRSPLEITRKLTYRDVLELMELRLSIPRIRLPGRQRRSFMDSDRSSA